MAACENGNLEIVKYLAIEAKANVNIKDTDGWTSLFGAAKNGY